MNQTDNSLTFHPAYPVRCKFCDCTASRGGMDKHFAFTVFQCGTKWFQVRDKDNLLVNNDAIWLAAKTCAGKDADRNGSSNAPTEDQKTSWSSADCFSSHEKMASTITALLTKLSSLANAMQALQDYLAACNLRIAMI